MTGTPWHIYIAQCAVNYDVEEILILPKMWVHLL